MCLSALRAACHSQASNWSATWPFTSRLSRNSTLRGFCVDMFSDFYLFIVSQTSGLWHRINEEELGGELLVPVFQIRDCCDTYFTFSHPCRVCVWQKCVFSSSWVECLSFFAQSLTLEGVFHICAHWKSTFKGYIIRKWQNWVFIYSSSWLMESRGRFCGPQNVSGASHCRRNLLQNWSSCRLALTISSWHPKFI